MLGSGVIGAADGPGPNRVSFGQDYGVLLRNLADPVRQTAQLPEIADHQAARDQ